MGKALIYIRKPLLLLMQISVLVLYYTKYLFDKFVRILPGKKLINESSFKSFQKMPKHIGIVFNTEHPEKYTNKIQEVLDLAMNIDGINEISLYFINKVPELRYNPSKVAIFTHNDVETYFNKEMNKKAPIEENNDPFKSTLELVIFFSQVHSLCGFFPWRLDLCTLVYPGDMKLLSKYTFYKSFIEYQATEQRNGK